MASRDARAALRVVAGPALIVASVLLALHQFVFQGLVGKGDPVSFFLPKWCLLGSSLKAGDLPVWDPTVMAGVPFAADPQSGWMYLLPMFAFTVLPCDVALIAVIVALPVIGGLGLYGFLRSEGASRPAATTGGVMLAVATSGSALIYSLPFTGALAWTAVLLAACSRFLRAGTPSARLAWVLAAALAWGQLAAAHFSVGLMMGTLAAAVYLVGGSWARGTRPREAMGMALLLAVASLAVNQAFLLPRLPYLRRTTLAAGYLGLLEESVRLGHPALNVFREGAAPDWPLQLGLSNGAHLGAALGLAFAGWRLPRFRRLLLAFALYGGAMYLASLEVIAGAIPGRIRSWGPVDAYLHRPEWTGYPLLLSIAVLSALGLDGWREGRTWRRRLAPAVPGLLLWFALPYALGASAAMSWLPLAGLAVAAAVLVFGVWRPAMALALPAVVAVQMVVNSLLPFRASPFEPVPELLHAVPNPVLDASDLVRPGPIPRAVLEGSRDGRILMLGEPTEVLLRYDVRLNLFGAKQAQGYAPTQLPGYWRVARAAADRSLLYNRTVFPSPSDALLDLLQVVWVVVPSDELNHVPPRVRARLGEPAARDGRWELRPVQPEPGPVSRWPVPSPATVVASWRVVEGEEESLAAVLGPDFVGSEMAILEEPPWPGGARGTAAGSAGGTADVRVLGADAARVEAEAMAPSVLVVRTAFDPHWQATVDGRPTRILVANHFLQGIPLPPGRHVVDLRYHDPWIGWGLVGSGLALGLWVLGIILFRGREASADAGR